MNSQPDECDNVNLPSKTGQNFSPNLQNTHAVDLTDSKKEDFKPTSSLIQKIDKDHLDDNYLNNSPK